MPCEDGKCVWKNKTDTFSDRGVHVTQVSSNCLHAFFFKGIKILLEYYNNYDDFILFCFETAEGTVDNESVNIVVVPDKFNNERSNLCDSMMKIYRKNYFYL